MGDLIRTTEESVRRRSVIPFQGGLRQVSTRYVCCRESCLVSEGCAILQS